ncbi:MAG: glutathione S-transferase [Kofleriaceae bacterium]
MLLYQDPRAPNPRRVRIFCAEKNLELDTIDVMIATGDHQKPAYLVKHPLGLLPVLELADGRVLRESMAICRYLEELTPAPNLFGVDAWERATIEQWNRHAEFELLLPIAQVFRNTHAFWQGRIKQAPEFGAIMREIVAARMAWLDGELASRRYLAGERFTVADITARCAIDFGKPVDLRIPDGLTHLRRWYDLVSERPSIKA